MTTEKSTQTVTAAELKVGDMIGTERTGYWEATYVNNLKHRVTVRWRPAAGGKPSVRHYTPDFPIELAEH